MTTTRLGKCLICKEQSAKYTCPGCEIKTCSLSCVNHHKEELDCDGMRNKTAYKDLTKFTNMDLLSDYRLLEDISRSVDDFANNPQKNYTRLSDLPKHLYLLRVEAHKRNMRLWFLPKHFKKHKENTTFLKWSTRVIKWKTEWIFQDSNKQENKLIKIMDVYENCILKDCIRRLLTGERNTKDQKYSDAGLDNLSVLLIAENIPQARKRYFKMNLDSSLKDNLYGHTLVEFPSFIVTHNKSLANYNIITQGDLKIELELEQQKRLTTKKQTDFVTKEYLTSSSSDGLVVVKKEHSPSSHTDDEVVERKVQKLDIPMYSTLCSAADTSSEPKFFGLL